MAEQASRLIAIDIIGHNLKADIKFYEIVIFIRYQNWNCFQLSMPCIIMILNSFTRYKDMYLAGQRISLENLMAYFKYQPQNLHKRYTLHLNCRALGLCGNFIDNPIMFRSAHLQMDLQSRDLSNVAIPYSAEFLCPFRKSHNLPTLKVFIFGLPQSKVIFPKEYHRLSIKAKKVADPTPLQE